MFNRRNAVTFSVPNGIDNLSQELRDLLNEHHKEEARPCPQMPNYDNVIWIEQECLDHLCANELFWDAMVNDELVSVANFRVRVKFNALAQSNLSNNNLFSFGVVEESLGVDNDLLYLTNAKYQSDFVLTADYIDNVLLDEDVEDWITARGIKTTGTFSFRKSPTNLKIEIKEYYNLSNPEGE